ncbi:MAG: urea ABC transporter ATP-binding subunit UrtE [Alphaproteobacteria bacterium]|nr:urea ABC transporter ATP-binding subunit UrtE [Alphaproteobacteria bacterium]
MLKVRDADLYYGASQALKGVSLTARKGEVTCVLGRNGVGKTSLIRGLVGHVPLRRGTVEWEGADITGLTAADRARAGLALVPQGREIFPLLTVEENLRTGLGMLPRAERKVPEDIFELFPVLRDMLRRRGGDLSGGQQQQLAIGRALATRPRLLVLDEPTEGIQPSIIKQIGAAISQLAGRRDIAILLVEQFFDFARGLADRFVVMDRGEVVMRGRPGELDEDELQRHLSV